VPFRLRAVERLQADRGFDAERAQRSVTNRIDTHHMMLQRGETEAEATARREGCGVILNAYDQEFR
jgi:hypothetical protein